jgi:hypothetical protein
MNSSGPSMFFPSFPYITVAVYAYSNDKKQQKKGKIHDNDSYMPAMDKHSFSERNKFDNSPIYISNK